VNAQAIARQYANALFAVAAKRGRAAEVGRDLDAFTELVRSNPDLARAFASPAVSPKNKRAVVDALLSATGDSTSEVPRLLTLLSDRDRLALLGDISAAYAARVNEANKVISAEVTTAVELPADRQAALAEALGRATDRHVTINGRVDPSILGGVVAQVGGMVFDGSLANQLVRLRQRLSASV
jgi:F-type H+-transporting ATPase subunit delta